MEVFPDNNGQPSKEPPRELEDSSDAVILAAEAVLTSLVHTVSEDAAWGDQLLSAQRAEGKLIGGPEIIDGTRLLLALGNYQRNQEPLVGEGIGEELADYRQAQTLPASD